MQYKMARPCHMHGREEECRQAFGGNVRKNLYEDLGVNGRIILN
jgi:hypothetical protein